MAREIIEHQPYLPGLMPELPLANLPENLADSELCEEVAEHLIRETSQTTLPVDVEAVAKFCGVTSLIHVPGLSAQGYFGIAESGAYIVRVRDEEDPGEKRLTIAHEIGHLLLRTLGREWRTKNLWNNSPVERFCDRFARALLAPRFLITPEVKVLSNPDQENIWLYDGQTGAITNELCNLLQKTGLPAPYLAQRLTEDLGLSQNSLASIVMGPKREKRDPRRRLSFGQEDHIFWSNTPFRILPPRSVLKPQERSDYLQKVSRRVADGIYKRALARLEGQEKSCRFTETVYLGASQKPGFYSWMDVYKTQISGIMVCQDSTPSYVLFALGPQKVAKVKAFSEYDFPYNYIEPHIIKVSPA